MRIRVAGQANAGRGAAKTPISLPRPMKAARGFCHAKPRPLREDADTIIARVRRRSLRVAYAAAFTGDCR
jgi:hypothetical protein